VDAALGHIVAIQDQDAIWLAQRFGDKAVMFGQDRFVILGPLANELLERHRFDVLAWHIGQEQPAQAANSLPSARSA
jgi:hypothetical protein